MKQTVLSIVIVLLAVAIALAQEIPMIIEDSVDIDGNGKDDRVVIKMVSGKFYNDTELWGGAGEKYEGAFTITVEIQKKVYVEHNLNLLFDGKLGCRDFFF